MEQPGRRRPRLTISRAPSPATDSAPPRNRNSLSHATHIRQHALSRDTSFLYVIAAALGTLVSAASVLSPRLRYFVDIACRTAQRIDDALAIRLCDLTDERIVVEQRKTGKRLPVSMYAELRDAVDRPRRPHGASASAPPAQWPYPASWRCQRPRAGGPRPRQTSPSSAGTIAGPGRSRIPGGRAVVPGPGFRRTGDSCTPWLNQLAKTTSYSTRR